MKVICVGRNYAAHAAELNNPVPTTPLLFMKPATAVLKDGKPFFYPEFTKDINYELEVVVKICKSGKHIAAKFAHKYYQEVSLGLDFTARDIQEQCKAAGHPWEIAKAFDNSAVIGQFMPISEVPKDEKGNIAFSLTKNGETVQVGNTGDMITQIDELIAYASQYFTLQVGDLIYTGTPKGVGPIAVGEKYIGYIGDKPFLECEIK